MARTQPGGGRRRWEKLQPARQGFLQGLARILCAAVAGALVSPLLGNPWYEGAQVCGGIVLLSELVPRIVALSLRFWRKGDR